MNLVAVREVDVLREQALIVIAEATDEMALDFGHLHSVLV